MNEAYCIALVFSRDQLRFQSYALQYTGCLLALHKKVIVFSPYGLDFQEQLYLKYRRYADKLSVFPVEALQSTKKYPSHFSLIKRLIMLRSRLDRAASLNKTGIDLVFFAPIEDWVKPKFKKWLFKKLIPYSFSGLQIDTLDYENGLFKLNVDPKYAEPDYLLSSANCVGICTIDRFNTEKIRSRIYKKVIVMPDISMHELPQVFFDYKDLLQRMAKGRLICGLMLEPSAAFPRSFLELILASPKEHYFFVMVGELPLEIMSEEDKELMETVLERNNKNFYFVTEAEFSHELMNYFVQCFEVIFIDKILTGLPSLLLSKASNQFKPIITVKYGQTALLVAKFRIGEVIGIRYKNQLEAMDFFKLHLPLIISMNRDPFEQFNQVQGEHFLKQSWEELLWF